MFFMLFNVFFPKLIIGLNIFLVPKLIITRVFLDTLRKVKKVINVYNFCINIIKTMTFHISKQIDSIN